MNITKNIQAANRWLTDNKPESKPITLDDVRGRLDKAGLLSINQDAKTSKGRKEGYLTGILYLAPHKIIGYNMCPFARTCIKDCLFGAGHGRYANVMRARIIKTLAWLHDPERFKANLRLDINRLINKAKKNGLRPTVRLNGTSDLIIERQFGDLLEHFKEVQFYDYTKNWTRFREKLPANYDLTFSYDGTNLERALEILHKGGRVSVVFRDGLPKKFLGFTVINGDLHDLRFTDDKSVIVGLTAKGTAKSETANTTFVINSITDPRCEGRLDEDLKKKTA